MKKELIYSCIWSVALQGSETWTIGKNEERVLNAPKTLSWRRILKIKWTDRITNDDFFSKGERREITFRNKKIYHSLIGHIIGHNEFVVNILKKQYPEKGRVKSSSTILKAIRQKHRS